MPSNIDRRSFLTTTAAAAAAATTPMACANITGDSTLSPMGAIDLANARPANGPAVIASGNGRNAVAEAYKRMMRGESPTDAVVQGVGLVEADPNDMTVGKGGLPNEEGVVQLDSSVMDGRAHKAGAVAAIENILHPAQVALKVLRDTDHVLIVGEGAYRFARAQGFPHDDTLLTERARQAWLRWKRNLNPNDDWLDDDQIIQSSGDRQAANAGAIPFTYGTINCSAVDGNGDLGSCTTTSGLSYKIPGRVGDSPIVGAGMFCDNAIGAAGATGRGESLIQSCGAFQIVQQMGLGVHPKQACLNILKWIADHTRRPELLNDRGEPSFNAVCYAVRKDGAFGSACMRGRRTFAYANADHPDGKIEFAAPLFT